MEDDWLTVGCLKRWIKDHKLSDDTKIYVQMPSSVNPEKANLHNPIIRPFDENIDSLYVRAWGPSLSSKRKKELYIDIYY